MISSAASSVGDYSNVLQFLSFLFIVRRLRSIQVSFIRRSF